MQIVIDISEEYYDEILTQGMDSSHLAPIYRALVNSVPLPKGHGDLIDRKYLLQLESKWYHLRNGDVACPKIDIDNAPTIIEADKESGEEG
jgi:hypothetical protein